MPSCKVDIKFRKVAGITLDLENEGTPGAIARTLQNESLESQRE
jgi:hypothetical protein